jgi:hypothetical protein
MKLHRGIIIVGNNNKIQVKCPGSIYDLPPLIDPVEFNLNDKVIGVIIEEKFNIIFNFNLSSGKNEFGYYTKKWIEDDFKIKPLIDFNPLTFDPYNSEYEFSEEIEFNRNQVISVSA